MHGLRLRARCGNTDLDVRRYLYRGQTSRIVASLIAQGNRNGERSKRCIRAGFQTQPQGDASRVDIQGLVGREGKFLETPLGVNRVFQLKSSRKLRCERRR